MKSNEEVPDFIEDLKKVIVSHLNAMMNETRESFDDRALFLLNPFLIHLVVEKMMETVGCGDVLQMLRTLYAKVENVAHIQIAEQESKEATKH
jgi:hypothetical protein